MTMPLDLNARKYYRAARQRLYKAELILEKMELSVAATPRVQQYCVFVRV